MNTMRIKLWIIVLASFAAATFALWNLIDEFRPSWDYSVVFNYWGAWCLFPGINMLMGGVTERPGLLRTCAFLAVLYACFYFVYVLDGSTRDLEGAQHMHVILVPFLSAFLFIVVHAVGPLIPPLRRLINLPFQRH